MSQRAACNPASEMLQHVQDVYNAECHRREAAIAEAYAGMPALELAVADMNGLVGHLIQMCIADVSGRKPQACAILHLDCPGGVLAAYTHGQSGRRPWKMHSVGVPGLSEWTRAMHCAVGVDAAMAGLAVEQHRKQVTSTFYSEISDMLCGNVHSATVDGQDAVHVYWAPGCSVYE